MAAGGATSEHSGPKPRTKPKAKAAAAPVEAARASDLAKTKLEVVLRQRGDAQAWALRVSPCDLGAEMSAKFTAHANALTDFYTELQALVIQRCEESDRYAEIYARLDPQLEPAWTDAAEPGGRGGGAGREGASSSAASGPPARPLPRAWQPPSPSCPTPDSQRAGQIAYAPPPCPPP